MSILGDLLLEGVAQFLETESSRARLLIVGAAGLALAGMTTWIVATSADPLNQPGWGFAAMTFSAVFGGFGIVVAGAYFVADGKERLAGAFCAAANLAAVVIPLVTLT
jgi:hypothetical protein